MAPTLNAGDDILVDLGDAADRLRDGIYVLRIDDALVVKRIALNPIGRRVTVQSDNPAYPDWPDCSLEGHQPDRPGDLVGTADRLGPSRRRSISQVTSARAMPVPVPIRMPFIGLPIARPSGNPARMQMVRKHPPARVVLGMAAPMAELSRRVPTATWSMLR